MKKLITLLFLLSFTLFFGVNAQTAVPVGSGSYANTPRATEPSPTTWSTYKIWVADTNTRPIPTNDWWTDLINSQYSGNLWAYPVTIKATDSGFAFYNPTKWNVGDMVLESPLIVKGTPFKPVSAIAKDWSDWTVVMNESESVNKYVDVTFGHGLPFAWVESKGFVPQIRIGAGYTLFDQSGAPLTLPITTDNFGILYNGYIYAVFLPSATSITNAGNNVINLNLGTGSTYFVLAAMTAKADLAYFYQYAYSIPRKTTVGWNYRIAQGKVDVTWNLTTQNLKGGAEKNVIQGFIPHHYVHATSTTTTFNGKNYACCRGQLKCATGTSFSFTYNFNGVLPYIPAPKYNAALPNPYDSVRMKSMVDAYSTKTGYGADTYWGGKDPLYYGQYMQMAKVMNNAPAFDALKTQLKTCLTDWFTYTPGETAHYFARYENWKGMIGFSSSYGSEQFTDNHFHLGYFIHSSALLGLYDADFLNKYGPMAKLVTKQYANWDRNDKNFPFLRTMDIWAGHSLAGGFSSGNGNNQESSSEAMQSWGGMFLLGSLLKDDAMRDAAVFGYVSESEATGEYWFDREKTNIPPSFPHTIAPVIFDGACGWMTWFTGDVTWFHGIQWLPISPSLNYLVKDTAYARSEWKSMMNDIGNVEPSVNGNGLGNVELSFLGMFDPNDAAKRFDNYWAANLPIVKDNYTGGISYYNIHSNRNLGVIKWDYFTSLPMSSVYYNKTLNQYTYIAYNPLDIVQTCTITKYDGTVVGSFGVPPHTYVATHLDSKLTKLGITAPTKVVEVGKTLQYTVTGYDQYGAIMTSIPAQTWSVSGGGSISSTGLFTATTNAYPVVVTLNAGTLIAKDTIRVGTIPHLANLTITPGFAQVTVNGGAQFTAQGVDQYGGAYPLTGLVWSIDGGGTITVDGNFIAGTTPGNYNVKATIGAISTSSVIVVNAILPNLALNKPVTYSTQGGTNTAAAAVDGSLTTRWESVQGVDPQWIIVDLQAVYNINQVNVVWENAMAADFTVDISGNGTTWTPMKTVVGNSNTNCSYAVSGIGRYIRINGTKRVTTYGYSIFELQVYGLATGVTVSKVLVSPSTAKIPNNNKLQFTANGYDANWNTGTLAGAWSVSGGGTIDNKGLFTATTIGGPYTVTYNNAGVLGTSQIYVVAENAVQLTTGIDDVVISTKPADITCYPNPVTDKLNVMMTGVTNYNLIQVIDINGKIAFQEKIASSGLNTLQFDLSNLTSGIYTVKLAGEDASYSTKIVKIK